MNEPTAPKPKKRQRFYRLLKLAEMTLRTVREWYEEFTPDWDREDEERTEYERKLKDAQRLADSVGTERPKGTDL